jgi:hypothetical protein
MINYSWNLHKENNQKLIKLFHNSKFVNFQKFLDWYWSK